MSLRYALLGLLREGPASGYDLMQIFRASLHHTWPATQSQLYTELGKLSEAGLITVGEQGPRGRKEYALSEAGLAELRHWLLDTKPERHPRNEAVLRVFLLGAVERDQAAEFLTWTSEQAAEDAAALREIEDSVEWTDADLSVYGRIALEYGKRLETMKSEWAAWAAAQVATREDEGGAAAE